MQWERIALAWALAVVWEAIALALLRRNERIALHDVAPQRTGVAVAIAVAAALAACVAPGAFACAAAIAVAGFCVASWGDARSGFLWDEIVVGTTLACALALVAGGRSTDAMCGGVLCGTFAYVAYYAGIAAGRETGFGDVKLAFGIGVALGPVAGIAAIAFGSIAWLAYVLAFAYRTKMPYARLRATPIPFGPGLSAGAFAATFVLRYVAM